MKISFQDEEGLLDRVRRSAAKRRLQFVLARFALELDAVDLVVCRVPSSNSVICEVRLVMNIKRPEPEILVRYQGEDVEEIMTRSIERARRKLALSLSNYRLDAQLGGVNPNRDRLRPSRPIE